MKVKQEVHITIHNPHNIEFHLGMPPSNVDQSFATYLQDKNIKYYNIHHNTVMSLLRNEENRTEEKTKKFFSNKLSYYIVSVGV